MRYIFSLVILLLSSSIVYSQSQLEGTVRDKSDQKPLEKASVFIVQAKDSILLNFTRTDVNGKFSLGTDYKEDYIVFITYPKFAALTQKFEANSKHTNLNMELTSVGVLLDEVKVTGRLPVTLKGDTVVYNAANFQTDANAKAEDLFRELPGITVDENGKITAQGKQVQRVLVEGEEFFGTDPVLVSRNVRADMIDKVEVFESVSEFTEKTGVDDGVRQQTINLTLKDNAKKGAFGSVTAGGGTVQNSDNLYYGKGMFNRFNNSQKIGAYFLASNNGDISLGFMDANKYGISSDNSVSVMDGGAIMIMGSASDVFSYWDGRGHPRSISGGVSYNNQWNKSNQKLNINYGYNQLENHKVENTKTQNSLPNGLLNSNNDFNDQSKTSRNRVNFNYEFKADSLTTISFNGNVNQTKNENNTQNSEITQNGNFETINENNRNQSVMGVQEEAGLNANFTRRMNKPGRSLSAVLNSSFKTINNDVFLKSKTNLYNINGDSSILIDQFKDEKSENTQLRGTITYTEPFTSALSSSISYFWNKNINYSKSLAYNSNGSNYNQLDEEYSNDFDYQSNRNSIRANLRYKLEKWDVNFRNELNFDKLYQKNNFNQLDNERDFFSYNPTLDITYKISRDANISLRSSKSTSLPSLNQIQPLKNNTNPLQIVLGNESLTPGHNFNHSLNYFMMKPLKGIYVFAYLSATQQYDYITLNRLVDPETGITTSIYENIKDKMGLSSSGNVNGEFPLIKKWGLNTSLGLGYFYSKTNNYINGELNESENMNFMPSIGFFTSNVKNLTFRVNFSPSIEKMSNSIQPEFDSKGNIYNFSNWMSYNFPLGIKLTNQINYTFQEPTQVFAEKFEQVLWNMSFEKSILKDNSLKIGLDVKDILNQNKGFIRRNSGNLITQNQYNTIGRNALLKLTWDFTTMKGQ